MSEIFISYHHGDKDKEVAKRLSKRLERDGFKTYWDRKIKSGSEWNKDLQNALKRCRCVIVLWSRASSNSLWVQGEATYAYKREVYLPFLIEDTEPPRLFRHVQTPSIAKFANQEEGGDEEILDLINAIKSLIRDRPMYGNLEKVAEGEPVTEKHLHIIHSCWRVDKELDPETAKKMNRKIMPYQIHVIIYGHWSALDRIEQVVYKLPQYLEGHTKQTKTRDERNNLFELKELAYDWTIIQAEIYIKNQPGHLELSRFINMSESGPRLLDDFIRRSNSNKQEK